MKHVFPLTGEPLVDVSLPPPEQHRDAIKALARLRSEAAAEVERLLAFLDALDRDADLEDDDREDDADREATDRDDDEDGRDDEPSLGWTPSGCFGSDDLEDEHDGAEPDDDGEPSLGSFDRMMNQTRAWREVGNYPFIGHGSELDDSDLEPSLGAGDDREDDAGDSGENDPAEVGIGDLDGLAECWSYFFNGVERVE